jgi:tetrahydromethanopterin S-methyltransferase subunit G
MSVIEDTRKLLQDFLAPELKELSVRLDAIEKRIDERFAALDQRIDAESKSAERIAAERHSQLMQAITRLADYYELRERISRIEARETAIAARPAAATPETSETRERAS